MEPLAISHVVLQGLAFSFWAFCGILACMKIYLPQKSETRVAPPGELLATVLHDVLETPCGGNGICGGCLVQLQYEGGEIEDVLEFTAVPQEPIDFMVLNEYTATNPNSMFRQVMGVNLRTPTGNIALNDGVLTINSNGEKTERPVAEDELKDVLKEYFGLVV